MKIVQINAVYGVGSTGRITRDIHNMLQANGHESYVFYAIKSNAQSTEKNIYKIGTDLDHKIHAFLRRLDKRQGWHSLIPTMRLCRKLSAIGPDVVHIHNLHSNYINLPYLLNYFAKNNVNVLLTLHDCWFFTGGCYHYLKSDCTGWKHSCSNCPQAATKYEQHKTKKMFLKKRELFGSIKNLYVNGVSDWTTLAASKSVLLKNAKDYRTIYNWVDTKTFFYSESKDYIYKKYNIPQDKKLILGVSQGWSKEKGLDEFVRLADRFKENAQILLVGQDLGVVQSENLKCIGFTESVDELRALYSAADVFVNPSKMETFGLVTVEAMACGTPVVAYNNTGSKEVVCANCGILAENGNADDLIKAVKTVLSTEKADYKNECIKYVLNKFSIDGQTRKYLTFYEYIFSNTYEKGSVNA